MTERTALTDATSITVRAWPSDDDAHATTLGDFFAERDWLSAEARALITSTLASGQPFRDDFGGQEMWELRPMPAAPVATRDAQVEAELAGE